MQLDHVLLALIRMRPGISGYQLQSIINDSTGFFFTVRNSQIYPALRRLLGNELATYETVIQDGKPNLKLYKITEEGERKLEEWLLDRFEFRWTRSSYDLYFLKLILMGHLEPEKIVSYIDWGIEMITRDKKRMLEDHLSIERDFLETDDAVIRGRFEGIWSNEYSFILKDMTDRIAELETIKDNLLSRA